MERTIANEFCLIDGRYNFNVNPRNDPELFFGRKTIHDEIMGRITKDSALKMPIKLLVYGDYGAGKTHLLRHLEYIMMQKQMKVKVVYLYVDDLNKKSHFIVLYRTIMKTIGLSEITRLVKVLGDKLANMGQLEDELEKLAWEESGSKIISKMLRQVFIHKDNINTLMDIWRWFLGDQLKVEQLNSWGVSSGLEDLRDYIKVLKTIGELYQKIDKQKLLILVDEAEVLEQITDQDAVLNWVNALRQLFDDDNSSVGIAFALGVRALDIDEMPEMFEHRAVRSRLINRTIQLGPLGQPDLISFTRELIKKLTKEECVKKIVESRTDVTIDSYPFTSEAWDEFVNRIMADTGLMKPRVAIKTLNEYIAEAFALNMTIIDFDLITTLPEPSE